PLGLQHTGSGESEKDIGAREDFLQLARGGLLDVQRLVVIHFLDAAGIDDALDVGHPDVLALDAHRHEQIKTCERRGARTGADELDVRQLLADDAQPIDDRRPDDDRSAVLIVVKARYLHALAAFALDVEALRRLDVRALDTAKSRLQTDDRVNQL